MARSAQNEMPYPCAALNERRYAWVETSPQAVVITDGEGLMLAVNTSFEEIVGLTRARLLGQTIEDLIIPSRLRAVYRALRRQAIAAGQSPTAGPATEFSALRADGGEFAADLRLACTRTEPPHLGTWIQDVSPDRASMAAQMSRAALNPLTEELAGVGSWESGPETERMWWSDNLFRIYGLRPGEITPSSGYVFTHCHPDDRERVTRAARDLGRGGWRPQLCYRFVWPDGTVRHLRSTVVSVVESTKRPQRISGTVQDVTALHQAEVEISARFAVSDALFEWRDGADGAGRLLRDLTEALEFELGVMWVPRGGVLVPWAIWQSQALRDRDIEPVLREIRLGLDVGLAGRCWASAEPVHVEDASVDPTYALQEIVIRAGLRGALALPAIHDQDVLAVFSFASSSAVKLAGRSIRLLNGIGYEIGYFLGRHRSELSVPPLTPRELQVLQLSATGFPRRRLAEEIGVSEATVKTHLEHIYRKLGVIDRASAVGEAIRQGLID